MKEVAYTIRPEQRAELLSRLHAELEREPEVRFAYLYGSLLESDTVHDIDVGLYLEERVAARGAKIAETLSTRLTTAIGLPIDARVVNEAPLSFLYQVLRGQLLVCRDAAFLAELIEDVARRYLNLAPFLRQSTKDAFAA